MGGMTDPAPMTLANMRAIGIRALSVHCRCGRAREVNVERFDDVLVVIRMHQHFRCGECEQQPQSVRPGSTERNAIGEGVGTGLVSATRFTGQGMRPFSLDEPAQAVLKVRHDCADQ